MLSSVRGGAASAMGVEAFRGAQARSTAPSASSSARPPVSSAGPAVVVQISQAARDLARSRASSPGQKTVTPMATPRQPAVVKPRILNLPTSRALVDNIPLSGTKIVRDGARSLSKPTLHTSLGRGATPLGRWTDGEVSDQRARRPGRDIERDGEQVRSANTLSARLQSGEVVSGQWNEGSYLSMRDALPGREIAEKGARARDARTFIARLGKGEEPLEVTPERHLVRPDGRGNAA